MASNSPSSRPRKKSNEIHAPSPQTEAARETSNTAGPDTPRSVNCTSPALAASISRPSRSSTAASARTPLRARGYSGAVKSGVSAG